MTYVTVTALKVETFDLKMMQLPVAAHSSFCLHDSVRLSRYIFGIVLMLSIATENLETHLPAAIREYQTIKMLLPPLCYSSSITIDHTY